jgi:hypothetical protein
VVKEWPDGFIAKAIVVILDIMLGEKDRIAILLRQLLTDLLYLLQSYLLQSDSRPTYPQALV